MGDKTFTVELLGCSDIIYKGVVKLYDQIYKSWKSKNKYLQNV